MACDVRDRETTQAAVFNAADPRIRRVGCAGDVDLPEAPRKPSLSELRAEFSLEPPS